MTDLCKLATKYGTDKIHYTPFYSLLLEGRRETTQRVLEIGIGTPAAMSHVPNYKPGASLRMWQEYFPNALIIGVDKDPTVLFEEERIKTACVNQSVTLTYRWLFDGEPFDLIVDDGSHNVEDQILTATILVPKCRGIYIIEDVNTPEELLDRLPFKCSYVRVRHGLEGRCVVIRG